MTSPYLTLVLFYIRDRTVIFVRMQKIGLVILTQDKAY